MATTRFFADLAPADSFVELFDLGRYQPVPEDWFLLITDVQGSTQAVKAGKYRAVNLVGAGCIIAVLNAAPQATLPYVFGGDGALIAVPPEWKEVACEALLGMASLSQEQYGLNLRVGAVPVADLYRAGLKVLVARYRLAGEDMLAMFWGDGLAKAETWVKTPGSAYLLKEGSGKANLAGLSCRWEPFRPDNGKILALLVKSREGDEGTVYRNVFEQVSRIAGGETIHPVKLQRLKRDFLLPSTMDLERRLSSQLPFLQRLWSGLYQIYHTVVGNILIKFNIKVPVFDPPKYLASTVQRSDFRKFDGMLRMVIEVPDAARPAIESLLEQMRSEGRIYYGLHWSDAAIMTCALFSMEEDRHLHFIDGGDGGYAFAAVGLKAQMAGA